MINIAIVPLDSRPCNHSWLIKLSKIAGINSFIYPLEKCGTLYKKASFLDIITWLNALDKIDYLILSTDGLCYGGLVQTRTGEVDLDLVKKNINFLKDLKQKHPQLKIYSFDSIMRNSITSLDDESKKYYSLIWEYAVCYGRSHYLKLEKDLKRKEELETLIPINVRNKYLDARQKKLTLNKLFLKLYKDGILDYHILLQEDATPYGIQKMDQDQIINYLEEIGLNDFKFYNGTDEGGAVLLAKIIGEIYNLKPKISLIYPNKDILKKIHPFEDIEFEVNLFSMLKAIGIEVVDNSNIYLAIYSENQPYNLRLDKYEIIKPNNDKDYQLFVKKVNDKLNNNDMVFLLDLLFPNGGSPDLLKNFDYHKLSGYSAWNTASNSTGTLLCQLMASLVTKDSKLNQDFTIERVIDDCIYQYYSRRKTSEELIKEGHSINELHEYGKYAVKKINQYFKEFDIFNLEEKFIFFLPWNRMFEIELNLIK